MATLRTIVPAALVALLAACGAPTTTAGDGATGADTSVDGAAARADVITGADGTSTADVSVGSDGATSVDGGGEDVAAGMDSGGTGVDVVTPADVVVSMDVAPGTCGSNADCTGARLSTCRGIAACGTRGACAMREFCLPRREPVCGCDGRDYDNDCERQNAGVGLRSMGRCSAVMPDAGPAPDAAVMCPGAGCCRTSMDCTRTQECVIVGSTTCGGAATGVCKTRPDPGRCWSTADCGGTSMCREANVCPCGARCPVIDRAGTCR